MRWISCLPRLRARRLVVLGLDIGPEVCSVVVLSGSSQAPDSVCCAECLALPDGMVADGEVLCPEDLGLWLKSFLEVGDYQPRLAYMGVSDALVSNHLVTLVAGLSQADVVFQLRAEVQSLLPAYPPEVCIDFVPDSEAAPAGQQRYLVQAVPRSTVDALHKVAHAAGLIAKAVEPRGDAAQRAIQSPVFTQLTAASAALALQCDEAFGLALRAWHGRGADFLPPQEQAEHALRRNWLLQVAVCAIGGAVLAAGFAAAIASAAEAKHQHMGDVVASALAYDTAHKAHAKAKDLQALQAEQARWLKTRKDLQTQSSQWSRVLSQSARGVWVASVKQQGTRWTVQGEALSSGHAQQLVQKLKALEIWAQAPELPQLQVTPTMSTTGLPVWQFRIEADLKVGV